MAQRGDFRGTLGSPITHPSYNPDMRKGLGRDIHINRKEPDFYMAPSTQHLTPSTKYPAPGTQHLMPGT